tara:strand:+ start:624 stop:1088 length:465 start_codon:yes stop_codon:yes gene_type:complete
MNELIKQVLTKSKTIAMVGVSSIKKDEKKSNIIRRRPSIIVMKYLQEFGYKIIPVNPFSTDKEIYGEPVMKSLEEINVPIDIVNVFRPSKETPVIAKQAISIGAKTLWLQYGIENEDAKKLVQSKNINYIANKCIKQEYQKLFLKANPVFPVLQ